MHQSAASRADHFDRRARAVLVVDDDAGTRDLLRDQLAEGGHHVDTAANGLEALERLSETRPQLLIFDLSMPVMDGWEMRRRILADASLADIPAVVLSCEPLPRDDALAVGAAVRKPVGVDNLLDIVDRLAATD